jgi:hypothetical protein
MDDKFVNHDNNNLLLETMSSMNFVDNSQEMMAQTTFSDSDFITAAGPFGGSAASDFLSSFASSTIKEDPPAAAAPAAAAPAAPAAEGAPAEGAPAAEGAEGAEAAAPAPPKRADNIYEKANVHYYKAGDKVYGHPVFKKMMDKYLPYHADLDPDTHWVNSWHMEKVEKFNDWDNDQIHGAMTSTEGYYPRKEDEDERKFAKMTNAEEHG